jgi:hypothetical protein
LAFFLPFSRPLPPPFSASHNFLFPPDHQRIFSRPSCNHHQSLPTPRPTTSPSPPGPLPLPLLLRLLGHQNVKAADHLGP